MNHQPYESWILDVPPGSPEEKEQLNKHIEVCPALCPICSKPGWKLTINSGLLPVKKAPQNFIGMWQNNLILFKEKRKAKTGSYTSGYVYRWCVMVALIALSAILLAKILIDFDNCDGNFFGSSVYGIGQTNLDPDPEPG